MRLKKCLWEGIISIGEFNTRLPYSLTACCLRDAHLLWITRCPDGRFLGDPTAVATWMESFNFTDFHHADKLKKEIPVVLFPSLLHFSRMPAGVTLRTDLYLIQDAFLQLTIVFAHFYGRDHQLALDFAMFTQGNDMWHSYVDALVLATSAGHASPSDSAAQLSSTGLTQHSQHGAALR